MDPDSITLVVIIVLAAILSAVFKAFSESFLRLDDSLVDEVSDVDAKKGETLARINSSRNLYAAKARSVAAVFDAVFAVVLCPFSVVSFTKLLSGDPLALSPTVSAILAAVITGAILLFVQQCIIRLIVLTVSRKVPVQFCASGLWFYKAVSVVLYPLTFLFDLPAAIFGISLDEADSSATEKEIRLMVDEGVIEDVQKEMINNVFEFDDRAVDEVMTHRRDIVGVDVSEASLDAVISLATESGYSRIPLYKDDIDSIIGVIYVKDLLRFTSSNEEFDAKKIMRVPMYVPESIHCRDLFKEFKEKKIQMAVVVDEYGGTSGIVTMEDIVESIVGNIQDEYDNEEEEFSKVSDDVYRFDGSVSVDEVAKLLGVEIEEEEYDTLGGFITGLLGRIPEDGEQPEVVYKNIVFHVILVEDRRIATVDAKIEKE